MCWNDRSVVDTIEYTLGGAWRIQMLKSEAQMEDLEKETRRWWFSPRSWLWNSMRDSMASSTEPIWIRAILWSFLKEKPTGGYQTLREVHMIKYKEWRSFGTRHEGLLRDRARMETSGQVKPRDFRAKDKNRVELWRLWGKDRDLRVRIKVLGLGQRLLNMYYCSEAFRTKTKARMKASEQR